MRFLPYKSGYCVSSIFLGRRRPCPIPLFRNADILPVTSLYYENICCLMHDVRYEKAPKNTIDLFTNTKTVHSYNTCASASRNFYLKHSKLRIQFKTFSRFGARTWNDTNFLREKPKKLFKAKLHEALLNVLHYHDDYAISLK